MIDRSYLAAEINEQDDLLRRILARRGDDVANAVADLLGRGTRSWVATGCGDSLFAGMCAEYWFAELGGQTLRALNAHAFSRYLYRTVDERTAVFAVSFSGTTARVIEVAIAARSRGATVVAITANEQSELVELSDLWLPNDAKGERSNTRTLSFQATCALLHLSAATLGASAVDARVAGAVGEAVALAEPVDAIAAELPEGEITIIGGGLAHPIACYGAAKLYEAATIPAHAAELEQFIHCEIFPVTPRSTVVIVAAAGPSYARAVEIADALGAIDAVTVGISSEPAFARHVVHHIPLPAGLDENHLPYLAAVPLQRLALALAARRGDNPDLVANKRVNRPLIESPARWQASDYPTT
jgi:glutamine---fructose-6-phosphate transaminase (isomerizing)